MTIKRRQKPFTFSDNSQIIAWQASWDVSMERRAIEETARTEKAKQNGSGDPVIFYFQEMIYAGLAACSTGDVPDLQKALALSDSDLDGWYIAARDANPTWYEQGELTEKTITMSDGSQITVLSKRPSVLLRRFRLDLEAERQPTLDNIHKEVFRITYYPKLAGCSVGDVPSMEEARAEWGEEDLQAWYDAALAVIPDWFLPLEQIAAQNQQRVEESQRKKKKSRGK